MGLVNFLTKRWIAGKTKDNAFAVALKLHKRGIGVIVNFLGESEENGTKILQNKQEYINLIKIISVLHAIPISIVHDRIPPKKQPTVAISVKLTQLGLCWKFNKPSTGERIRPQNYKILAYDNLFAITKEAEERGVFVWVDMEKSIYTEATLEIIKKVRHEYNNIGVALQANLKNTYTDLAGCLTYGIPVRLCKGAYAENEKIAFQNTERIYRNYTEMLYWAFANKKSHYLAIATHDEKITNTTLTLMHATTQKIKEFQMLFGVNTKLQEKLAKNHSLTVYIPYGPKRIPYVIRRLREKHSRNFILRAVFNALVRGH